MSTIEKVSDVGGGGRPMGPDAVRDALVEATIELIVSKGMAISVREIAAKADVNHGLIHTYFGSKDGLFRAAFDHLNTRAARERDAHGFPPLDLANRRGGELAKALARVTLDAPGNPFSAHPISDAWLAALEQHHPELSETERTERVITASSLALGWALFAEHLCTVHQLDEDDRAKVADRIEVLVAEIGRIPREPAGAETTAERT